MFRPARVSPDMCCLMKLLPNCAPMMRTWSRGILAFVKKGSGASSRAAKLIGEAMFTRRCRWKLPN